MIPARVWNREVVDVVRRLWVCESRDITVERTRLGQVLSARRGARWRHPWNTRARWEREAWRLNVQAGFVNGVAPVVAIEASEAPEESLARERAAGRKIEPGTVFDVPLYEEPQLVCTWRAIGWDGEPGENVLPFFLERGAAPARRTILDSIAAGRPHNLDDDQPPAGLRLLRACDLVLRVPRRALTAVTELGDPQMDGYSLQQTLSFTPRPVEPMRLRTVAKLMPTGGGLEPKVFDAVYQEANVDELLIATLYALSPVKTAAESAPDGRWEVFVKHHDFWNLSWRQPRFNPAQPPEPLRFDLPLAAGVAQGLASGLLSSVNDAWNAVNSYLGANSLAGRFWSV